MKNNWGVKITAKDPGGKKRKEKTKLGGREGERCSLRSSQDNKPQQRKEDVTSPLEDERKEKDLGHG